MFNLPDMANIKDIVMIEILYMQGKEGSPRDPARIKCTPMTRADAITMQEVIQKDASVLRVNMHTDRGGYL